MSANPALDVETVDRSHAGAGERAMIAQAARTRLIILAVLGGVATITGVSLFSWPSTLGVMRATMIYVHDASGDLLIVAGIAYLTVHLRLVWRLKKRLVSRWTGYVTVASWLAAASTGVYGQVEELESGSILYVVHLVSSLALIVLACFHGAWGLRPAKRS